MTVFHHLPQEQLGQNMDRRHIQIDQRQFFVQIRLQKAAIYAHPCVVDNKINVLRARLLAGLLEKAHTFLSGRQVGRDHDHVPLRILMKDLAAQLLKAVLPAGRQDQVVALDGQVFGNLHTDAGTGAGYKCIHTYPLSISSLHGRKAV